MKFTITNKVLCEGLPNQVATFIKDSLTVVNPEFADRIAMEKSIFGVDEKLKYYIRKTSDSYLIPVGFFEELLNYCLENGYPVTGGDIYDQRVQTSDKEFFSKLKFKAQLRPYQEPIEDHCLDYSVGVIQAKTGSGKTVSFIKVICERKVNTMVLVDTKDLANQTVDALIQFTNLKKDDIGFIGDGRYEVKPITVCILKSLTLMDKQKEDEVHSFFGQVITDEVHIIAANTYFKALSAMPAKFKFGFSATLKRADGLTPVIFWANGPLRYKVPDEDVAHALIIPSYIQVDTDYYFPLFDTSEYQAMLTHMAEDEERNKLILAEFMKRKERPSVFLCMRQSHVEILADLIPSCVPLISSLSTKDRAQNMADLKSGKAQNAATTFALFAKGMDVPRLEVAYLCGPMKAETKLRQTSGRVMRKSDATGKETSLMVDFIDKRVGLLYGQSRTRAKILRDL